MVYSGDGTTTAFPFPHYFILDEDLKVLHVDEDGVVTSWVLDTDYTQSGAADPDGGTITATTAPVVGDTLIIYKDPARTQAIDLDKDEAIPPETLETGLDKLTHIALRLYELVSRSLRLPDSFTGTFSTEIPTNFEAGSIPTINDDADGIEWKTPAQLVAEGVEGGGVPEGGAEGAALVKASSDDGDATWADLVFEGVSRYGAWSSAGLVDTLTKILNIQYTAPSVSLSASGSTTTREKGDAVTATTLTASITKQSDPIAEVRFYEGASLLDTQNSGGGIPTGGNSTFAWTGSFSDNKTFSVQVDDDGSTGGPTTVTSNRSFTFVYPYYVGAGAASLTAANVASLTKRIITSTSNRTETITATAGQVFYFAYPASYGALTSILDVNGFETLPDWTLRTENITGLDATAQSYRIYEFNNPVTADDYEYTFIR